MIHAECHSDDHRVQVEFDATRFFRQAGLSELVALTRCDFGGNKAADNVALYRPTRATNKVFTYCRLARVGFECHIDMEQAMAWIHKHRPAVADLIGLMGQVHDGLLTGADALDREAEAQASHGTCEKIKAQAFQLRTLAAAVRSDYWLDGLEVAR